MTDPFVMTEQCVVRRRSFEYFAGIGSGPTIVDDLGLDADHGPAPTELTAAIEKS
jgi:hypothetical protein